MRVAVGVGVAVAVGVAQRGEGGGGGGGVQVRVKGLRVLAQALVALVEQHVVRGVRKALESCR